MAAGWSSTSPPSTGSGPSIPEDFYDINVNGTRRVLEAARSAGCERLVYTSTVGTLGLHGATTEDPVDETSFAHVDHLFGGYKQSKYVAEHEVLRAGAEGLPVVLVQPTTPVGPRDRGPTPTGRTVLEILNGRFPGYVDTTLNIVDVEDVAHGHVLAAERGGDGRSYILGGENLTLRQVLAVAGRGHRRHRPHPGVPWQFRPGGRSPLRAHRGTTAPSGADDSPGGGQDVDHPYVLRRQSGPDRAGLHLPAGRRRPGPGGPLVRRGRLRPARSGRQPSSGPSERLDPTAPFRVAVRIARGVAEPGR